MLPEGPANSREGWQEVAKCIVYPCDRRSVKWLRLRAVLTPLCLACPILATVGCARPTHQRVRRAFRFAMAVTNGYCTLEI